jgi:hypothetical protein
MKTVNKSVRNEIPTRNTPVNREKLIAKQYGDRLMVLARDLEFSRALIDVLCFEKQLDVEEESISTIKYRLWEMLGAAETAVHHLDTALTDVLEEAVEVSA